MNFTDRIALGMGATVRKAMTTLNLRKAGLPSRTTPHSSSHRGLMARPYKEGPMPRAPRSAETE